MQNKSTMSNIYKGIIILLLLTASTLSQAQKQWTLEECMEYAMDNSLLIQQGSLNNQIDQVNLKQARQSRLPNLNGSLGANFSGGRSEDPRTGTLISQTLFSNNISIGSGITIFNGNAINNTIEQNRINALASKLDIDVSKANIALNIGTSYVNALLAKERVKEAQTSLELSQKQLERVDKLIAAGSIPRNDRLDVLAQIANNEQSIILAENNLMITLLSLEQSMNYQEKDRLVIAEAPEVLLNEDPFLLDVFDVYELSKKTFLKSDAYRLQSADLGVDIAKAGLLPQISASVGVGTSYGRSNSDFIENDPYKDQLNENLGYRLGLNVNIPIFNNFQTKAQIERAKINSQLVETQNAQNAQTLLRDVQTALTDAQSSKKQLEAAEKSLEAQEAAFVNAEKRFDLGAINSFDLVTANNQYNSARINQIIQKYDFLFKMKILDIYMGKPLSLGNE